MFLIKEVSIGNVPQSVSALYHFQRASAGLIVTEATQVSPKGLGLSLICLVFTASNRCADPLPVVPD